ncbi:MAG: glycosyltransferase family 4 protein, partial [Marmoricola sp.]
KGHDVLFAALARCADLRWRCVCVGARDPDPGFADRLGQLTMECGIGDRIRLDGPLVGADLDAAYAAADLLVLASHAETYGMVVTEALARGVPVVATAVGGVPEALGHGSNGSRPGLLVPAGDSVAFAAALRGWLGDAELRREMRRAAGDRRRTLTGWSVTADRIAQVLLGLTARPSGLPVGLRR